MYNMYNYVLYIACICFTQHTWGHVGWTLSCPHSHYHTHTHTRAYIHSHACTHTHTHTHTHTQIHCVQRLCCSVHLKINCMHLSRNIIFLKWVLITYVHTRLSTACAPPTSVVLPRPPDPCPPLPTSQAVAGCRVQEVQGSTDAQRGTQSTEDRCQQDTQNIWLPSQEGSDTVPDAKVKGAQYCLLILDSQNVRG